MHGTHSHGFFELWHPQMAGRVAPVVSSTTDISTKHWCPGGNPVPRCVQQENGYNPIYLPHLELAVVFDSCQELGW